MFSERTTIQKSRWMIQGMSKMKIKIPAWSINDIDIILEYIVATVLVISPVFQHYVGPLFNAGYTALAIGLPLILLLFLLRFQRITIQTDSFIAVALVFVYYLYHVIDHGFSMGALAKCIILVMYLIAIVCRFVRIETIVKVASAIALTNLLCLMAQYICFYVLKYKLQFVNASKLLDSSSRWLKRVSTTSISDVFYRPSALFLEPSHVFLFTFPVALYHLFGVDANKKSHLIGILLIVSILLSTSGMGLAFSIFALTVYFVMYKNTKYKKGSIKNFFTPKAFFIICAGMILLIILYNNVDIVYKSIVRIVSTDYKGYNALSGRTAKGDALLEGLQGFEFIFGISDAMGELGTAISGYQGEFWKYGIIGIIISYGYYAFCMIKSKASNYLYMCLLLIGISFFCGHTHREFYVLYFSSFIINGVSLQKNYLPRQNRMVSSGQ